MKWMNTATHVEMLSPMCFVVVFQIAMLASVTRTNEAWVGVFSEREAKTKIPNEENKHNTVLIDNLVCNQTRV